MAGTRRIYLDNHATTACDPRVVEAMLPYFAEKFGNPASKSHDFGWEANEAVERAREGLAKSIGAEPKEIVFTSGATEANNLALLGAFEAAPEGRDGVVTVATEHHAVLDVARALSKRGARVVVLPVDAAGFVDPAAVEAAVDDRTAVVSVMAANNEIGTLHPVAEIGRIAARAGAQFHCDAAQALGRIPLDVRDLGVQLLSLSAHKFHGPKGIGALFLRRREPRARLAPQIFGGGHERGYRPGTLPTPLAVGMGLAAELAVADLAAGGMERVRRLRDRLLDGLRARIPDLSVNGGLHRRLPNNLNVSFPDVPAEALLIGIRGIAASSGSACTSASPEPSYVLRAIGVSVDAAVRSLRFGLSRYTTEDEIEVAIDRIAETVERLRALHAPRDGGRGTARPPRRRRGGSPGA